MSQQQTLICEHDNHTWTRKPTRGKKPRFCPDHLPTKVVKTDTVTLTCAAGHTWERPRTKGKQPKYCPEHKPETTKVEPKMQTLNCAHDGHEWQRLKRGKPPKFCPEHKPIKATARTKVTGTGIPKVDLDNDLVNAILNDPSDSELKRKIAYVVNEFRNPRPNRDMSDWDGLHYTFKRLLQDAARALKPNTPNPIIGEV